MKNKQKTLGCVSLYALATALAVYGTCLPQAHAASPSLTQLQAELNSVQEQIDLLKAQQRRLDEQTRELNERATSENQVATQQATVAEQQARIAKQQTAFETHLTNIEQPPQVRELGKEPTFDWGQKALLLPGNVTIALHGRFGGWGAYTTSNTYKVAPPTGPGEYKLSNTIGDAYVTLAPSVDFQQSKNTHIGLRSVLWISQTAAGTGANENGTTTQGLPTFVVHFGYAYFTNKHYGTANLGQAPGTFTIMEIGQPDLDGGGWDAPFDGGLATIVPSVARPYYLHGTTAALDSTLKAVYVSPEWHHFSVGASYEPNANGIKEGDFTCTVANSICSSLIASPTISDIGKKRRNTIDATIKYDKVFNTGDEFSFSTGVLHGATVAYNGVPLKTTPTAYNPLQVLRFGAAWVHPVGPGNLTLEGNMEWGKAEDFFDFEPKGAPDAFEYIIGSTYHTQHWKFGASYFVNRTSGNYNPLVRNTGRYEIETGPAVEVGYYITKQWELSFNYLYGSKQQANYNFITSTPGSAANNYIRVNVVGIGTEIYW